MLSLPPRCYHGMQRDNVRFYVQYVTCRTFAFSEVIFRLHMHFLCANYLYYCKIYQMYGDRIKSMGKCPSEVYVSSANQKVLCTLWILKVYFCGPYPEPDESSLHPHILVILRRILILFFRLCLDLFLWFYYQILHAFLFCAMHAICPAHFYRP